MKLHQLIAEAGYNKLKAGIIPFLDDGRCLFAVSSNAAFGGSDPAIAKGRVDAGESAKEAAVREGEEELGLRKDNMAAQPFLGWKGELTGLDATYPFEVYAVLVKDEDAFDKPHYETERTVWLTRSGFKKEGRASQATIVDHIFEKIDTYLGRGEK